MSEVLACFIPLLIIPFASVWIYAAIKDGWKYSCKKHPVTIYASIALIILSITVTGLRLYSVYSVDENPIKSDNNLAADSNILEEEHIENVNSEICEDDFSTYEEFDPDDYDLVSKDAALEYIYDTYSLNEIILYYNENNPENFHNYIRDLISNGNLQEEFGLVDMELILEEMEDADATDLFGAFLSAADRIGYDRSAILPPYCIDRSTNLVHDTNSDCLNQISYWNMHFTNTDTGDLCPLCFPNR